MPDTDSPPVPPAQPALTHQPARSAFIHPDSSSDLTWQGSFIGTAEPSRPNQWSAFRRGFFLSKTPRRAIARIAADSKYWLWLNGEIIVREGGLKRGPTPTDTYYDEIDLTSRLCKGRNTFAVLVWYFGKNGFSHYDSGLSGFLLQIDASGHLHPLLVSDKAWRACPHPAFGDTRAPHPNYRLPESNICFDARIDIAGWTRHRFNDRGWAPAVELGRAACGPWNRLVRRPVPFWRDYGLKSYINGAKRPFVSSGRVVKMRLPYNAHVTPSLKIEARAGLRIGIRTDNYRGGSAPNVRAEFITRGGVQEFECYGWMNGHNVYYSIPAGVKIIHLGYRESGFDCDVLGTFSCDDPFMERLREKAVRTLYVTMRDSYMDCPDRERAQWWGDVVNELGEVFYTFDRRADSLTRKAILELIAWQKPDGVLFSPIPSGNWDRDLPLQMLASVGRLGFWTYALYSGDLTTLRAVYPGVKRYLEIWNMQSDGLTSPRLGSWPWGDWGENVDMTILANIWYHLALQGQREMAKALGHHEDLPWIEGRLHSIQRAFQPTFWTGTEFRSPDYRGATDDRANALAVVAGLTHRKQYPLLLKVFQKQEHASPYMEKYVLEALCMMGEPTLAQVRMKRRYAKMVDHPRYSTLWEGWGIGKEGFGGGTINHAWSGGPLTIMSQYFAGVAPTSLAFATYQVNPQLGVLREITAGIETQRGTIQVAIRRRANSLELELSSPPQTLATVGIPAGATERITRVRLNSQVIWESGRNRSKIRGVKSLGFNAGYLRFEVPPGKWAFSADVKQSAP